MIIWKGEGGRGERKRRKGFPPSPSLDNYERSPRTLTSGQVWSSPPSVVVGVTGVLATKLLTNVGMVVQGVIPSTNH